MLATVAHDRDAIYEDVEIGVLCAIVGHVERDGYTYRGVTRINDDFPDQDHRRWKAAASWRGISLKEWVTQALNRVADLEDAERAERKRRSR